MWKLNQEFEFDASRLRDLLESISDGFYALDSEWRYVVFNRAAEDFFGVQRQDLLGRVMWDLFPQGRGTAFEAACTGAMKVGAVTRFETKSALRPDRTVELRIGGLSGGGIAVTLTDITERVRDRDQLQQVSAANAALAAEQAAILAQLAEGVIVADAAGEITFVNDAAQRIHGVSRLGVAPDDYSEQYRLFTDDGRPFPSHELPLTRAVTKGASIEQASWRIRRPDGSEVRAVGSARPIFDEGGRQTGAVLTVRDDTQRSLVEAALRESEEDYRNAAELNPQVAWTATPDGQLDRVAPRWMQWTGKSGLGSSYAESLHADDVDRTFAAWGHSVSTGEPYDIVHRVHMRAGGHRWIRSRAYPRRAADGTIVRWYGATEDIDEQKRAEEHLNLMVLELNHRVKNNLATVQAIAVQTLDDGGGGKPGSRETFLGRITALAAAHDILTREQWDGARLEDIASSVLQALGGTQGRVRLNGPAVRLGPRSALALSMAFHELGTNALKYGALSRPGGQVHIDWGPSTHSEPETVVTWVERGGPAVHPPSQRGFGSRLLEKGLASQLDGEVKMNFEPTGLTCSIRACLEP